MAQSTSERSAGWSTRSGQPDRPEVDTSPVRILIVDHSDLVRQGIRSILREVAGFEVVGLASTAAAALEACSDLAPDVVLMDGALPDGAGYDATRPIFAERPGVAVVMLTASDNADHALDAFACGSNGYLSKESDGWELIAAVRRAAAGKTSVDPELGARLLRALAGRSAPAPTTPEALTPRELDVLRLIAEGRTNKEIANGLLVAIGTVKVHVERIFGKLGTSTRSEAAVRAIRLGLVEPGDGTARTH